MEEYNILSEVIHFFSKLSNNFFIINNTKIGLKKIRRLNIVTNITFVQVI